MWMKVVHYDGKSDSKYETLLFQMVVWAAASCLRVCTHAESAAAGYTGMVKHNLSIRKKAATLG